MMTLRACVLAAWLDVSHEESVEHEIVKNGFDLWNSAGKSSGCRSGIAKLGLNSP